MKIMNSHFSWSLTRRINHHLMLNTSFSNNLGLLNGKMGVSIAFYLLGRRENNEIYTDFGGGVLDEIFNQLQNSTAIDFDSGLCGIGWGLEYLIQNQFVKGEILEICEEIDRKIMQFDPRRIDDLTLEKGMCGLLHYVLIHLKGCYLQKNICPFDSIYLNDLYTKVKDLKTLKRDLLALRKMYLDYIEKGVIPNYLVDIASFRKEKLDVKSEQLLTYPLGIQMGLAGALLLNNND